jgi:hypothetical protein
MGGHLVHLIHWLTEEAERGPLAVAGIVLGAILGTRVQPLMAPTEGCTSFGIGRDALGHCPDVFSFEGLLAVLFVAAIGAFIAWMIAESKQQPS